MTTEQLHDEAACFVATEGLNHQDTYDAAMTSYQAGFKKALELMREHMQAAPYAELADFLSEYSELSGS